MTHLILAKDEKNLAVFCRGRVVEPSTAVFFNRLHVVDCPSCLYAAAKAGKRAEEYWYGVS